MESILFLGCMGSLINFASAGFYDVVSLNRQDVTVFLLILLVVFGGMIILSFAQLCKKNAPKPNYCAIFACFLLFVSVAVLLYFNMSIEA
jgi:hypothetical protein